LRIQVIHLSTKKLFDVVGELEVVIELDRNNVYVRVECTADNLERRVGEARTIDVSTCEEYMRVSDIDRCSLAKLLI
jgi:hypothetical protein